LCAATILESSWASVLTAQTAFFADLSAEPLATASATLVICILQSSVMSEAETDTGVFAAAAACCCCTTLSFMVANTASRIAAAAASAAAIATSSLASTVRKLTFVPAATHVCSELAFLALVAVVATAEASGNVRSLFE